MSSARPDELDQHEGDHEPVQPLELWITNVRLPPPSRIQEEQFYDGTWTVKCSGGVVVEVSRSPELGQSVSAVEGVRILDARGGIMLPSLCHSHIHLDKCFILDKCGELTKGDFNEAMTITLQAKGDFSASREDLYQRGARLIEESVEIGVTSMRAHVEVDTIVGFSCLDVALDLKFKYKDICDVQIAVFAQEALFPSASDIEPGENYSILCQAMQREGVSVVGSAPYVEPTMEQAKKNIKLIFEAVMSSQESKATSLRDIDFHLDYNLDPAAEPLIHEVIAQTRSFYNRCSPDHSPGYMKNVLEAEGTQQNRMTVSRPHAEDHYPPGPCITIGHATRLQLFSASEWHELRTAIAELPIYIVGLPQSDMYIQGRAHQASPLGPPRSTLRIPFIERAYGIKVAMAVNNVDNAFTPQGTLDPLSSLVTFGVAIFQAVTPREIRTLIEGVTLTSKRAIGFERPNQNHDTSFSGRVKSRTWEDRKNSVSQSMEVVSPLTRIPADLFPTLGDRADFVVLHENGSLRSVALHPSFDRTTIKDGRVIAKRRKWRWISGRSN